MRLDDESESTNFEDRSGGGGGGFGGGGFPLGGLLALGGSRMGCGTIVILIVLALVFGINPLSLLGMGGGGNVGGPVGSPQQTTEAGSGAGQSNVPPATKSEVLKVLGSTERRWTDIFARNGQTYRPTALVFYSRQDQSGCGAAQAAMGPFYCPADQKIYLDTSFFNELHQKFGAPGDFAEAYVIAHEVGHHVQYLTGIADKVRKEQARAGEAGANALQVDMELQADCYAGVWAANDKNLLEPGDADEGLKAAQSIGDDTLQEAAGQRPVPESFTHGTAAQRMMWLKRGLTTGDPKQCDTFAGT